MGPLLGAQIGESLRLHGRWTSHVKFGRQFEVRSYTTVLPATEQGIRRALAAAVRTAGSGRRHTALAHRLQAAL